MLAFMTLLNCRGNPQGDSSTPFNVPPAIPQPVIDAFETLKDGNTISYRVRAGSYRLQVTATNDGAGVTWVGGQCQ